MYVFLKEGPVHLVAHRTVENDVIARGWSRTALERFLTTSTIDLTESIYLDETADYCWRAQRRRAVPQRGLPADRLRQPQSWRSTRR